MDNKITRKAQLYSASAVWKKLGGLLGILIKKGSWFPGSLYKIHSFPPKAIRISVFLIILLRYYVTYCVSL